MKIVLDLDDVLCNFVDAWCNWAYEQKLTPVPITRGDVSTYDYFFKTFGKDAHDFYLKDPYRVYRELVTPFDGSKDFMVWCHENFDEVQILSHATNRHSKICKREFVNKHFDFDNIDFSSSRVEKFNFTKDCILVDDFPTNVLKHVARNNNHGIIFNRNNGNGWAALHKYDELITEEQPDLSKMHYSNSYCETKYLLRTMR